MKFTDTRSRSCDPQTSREAGKEASSDRSTKIRLKLHQTIRHERQEGLKGWTARELSRHTRIPLDAVYRRLSEISGIAPHPVFRRGASRVWVKA